MRLQLLIYEFGADRDGFEGVSQGVYNREKRVCSRLQISLLRIPAQKDSTSAYLHKKLSGDQ